VDVGEEGAGVEGREAGPLAVEEGWEPDGGVA